MPIFLGVQVFLRGKGLKLVCPGHYVIQWYMRYVRFKSQTVCNAKYSYHCSGPLESYLYTQMCPVLANVLILMVLNDILRLSHQRPRNLDVVQMVPRNHRRQVQFEYRRLRKRKAWVSSHFKSVPVVTMTWQLIAGWDI